MLGSSQRVGANIYYASVILLFSFQHKHTSFFHSYGKYQKHQQALSLSRLICCSSPSCISDSHSSQSITICQTARVATCPRVSAQAGPSLQWVSSLISLGNVYKFIKPSSRISFLKPPCYVSGFFVTPAAPLYFLRMPSVGTIFMCTTLFFIGPS